MNDSHDHAPAGPARVVTGDVACKGGAANAAAALVAGGSSAASGNPELRRVESSCAARPSPSHSAAERGRALARRDRHAAARRSSSAAATSASCSAEVTGFDLGSAARALDARCRTSGEPLAPYDSLIVAGGSRYSYFGHDDWRPFAPDLKSLESALDIRGADPDARSRPPRSSRIPSARARG